jgi:hypothetical protein
VLRCARDVTDGLAHLHSVRVYHRDLKSANVLRVPTDSGFVWKLGDFGLAQVKASTRATMPMGGMVGTLPWMAPELHDPDQTEAMTDWPKADVYAYAMVLYELLERRLPFASLANSAQFVRALEKGSRPDLSAPPPPGLEPLATLMRALWVTDPSSRPAVDHALVERLEAIANTCAPAGGEDARAGGHSNAAGSKSLPTPRGGARFFKAKSPPPAATVSRAAPRPNWFARRREAAAARAEAKRNAAKPTAVHSVADKPGKSMAANAAARTPATLEADVIASKEELTAAKAVEEAARTRREAALALENAARHEREVAAIARKAWVNSLASGVCGAVAACFAGTGGAAMSVVYAVGRAAAAVGSCACCVATCGTTSSALEIRVGVRVRVKRSVVKPRYGWAAKMTHASIGVVRRIDSDGDPRVDFPGKENWAIDRSEVEVVGCCASASPCSCFGGAPSCCGPSCCRPSCCVALSRTVSEGAHVRVKRSVVTPRYEWGGVDRDSIGVVTRIDADGKARVDFPEQSDWKALVSELEVVASGEKGKSSGAADAHALRRGARVRVRRSVSSPKYGWGEVDHDSIGVVTRVDDDGDAHVDFPAQSSWLAVASELEIAELEPLDAEEMATHDCVQCDNCDEVPIVGNRYKCAECSDFDLCESCYEDSSEHDHHAFVRYRTPAHAAARSGEKLPARGSGSESGSDAS